MSSYFILILIFASASALPSRYAERNNYGFEVASLNEPLTAGSAVERSDKHPKNSAGKTEESGYHKTFGTDADGEKGFESGVFSNGENGYKELDTFHKQIGDKYGFEEHSEFGHGQEADGHQSNNAQEKKIDADGAGTSVESYYTEGNGGSSGSGEYSGGGDTYYVGGDGDNNNEEYTSGDSGEGAYSQSSSYSNNSNDNDKSSSSEYDD